ncbi:hypothetical protein D3C85_918420 [compost metagenome]
MAELQRAADAGQLQVAEALAQAFQQTLLGRAAVAPAGDHGEGFVRSQAHADRPLRAIGLGPPGAQAGAAVVAAAIGRNPDHAEHHPTLLDQGDVYGELFAASDKFLGAVERVDQPPAAPLRALAEGDIGVLLGQHRNARIERDQTIIEDVMSGHVGGGHRRGVGLLGDPHTGAPMRQNRRAGLAHQLDDRRNQGMAHGMKSPRWVSRSRAR